MIRTTLLLLLAGCLPLASLAGPAVTAKKEGSTVVFRAGEKEMFRYQAEPGELPRPDIKKDFTRGGYLFPILTPSGKLVVDDFPPNHIHHHGIWWAWTKTEIAGTKPDFWNMGDKKGRVEFRSLDEVWEKDGAAGLKAQHAFVNLLTSPASDSLLETWEIRATAVDGEKPRYVIDFTTTQRCAGNEALKLPLYRYGGLGFRGHSTWDGAGNCEFLTSEGITDRVKGNESKGRWIWAGGTVDGATAGVTILSHPDNFRAPQPLRIHPTEPFVCFAPQQAGDMEIKPGETYVSRYRFVIADGKPAAADADAWWKEYTEKKEGK